MKKMFLFFVVFIAFNCAPSDFTTIEGRFSGNVESLFPKLKDLLIQEGFTIEEENIQAGILNSGWKKLDRSENNIPDNTIEGKIEIVVTKILNDADLKVSIKKRSSLASKSKKAGELTYEDVGLIYNDILYKKWDGMISKIKKEFEPNRP